MEYYKCLAVPKTSVKRCRNYSTNGTPFCSVHGKIKGKQNSIQLYNGAIYTFGNNLKEIKEFTPQIFLWKELNREIGRAVNKSLKKRLENQAKLIRCGSQTKIIEAFVKTGVFPSCETVLSFFQKKNSKKLKRKNLEKAKHFLGVIYYFQRNIESLKRIQIRAHIKLAYGNQTDNIIRIQRWFRHKMWLKKLPVKPSVMRKHFIPNTNKIVTIQRHMRKYIAIKVKHSHNCPYSLERYTDIPEKYRVVYEYTSGNSKHWRYYNIKWLDADWKSQTKEKRFVIEPSTKIEFPDNFVEEVARKIWVLSRQENDYLLDQDETKEEYIIENDWNNSFMRRSLYRFSLMMLDLCNLLEVNIENINNWRKQNFKLKYQMFYLQVMPALKNIASNTHLHNLEEDMFYITRDMFQTKYIFPDTDISDEIAGDAIYGILRTLIFSKRQNAEIYEIIKDVIKENFQTLLMV